MLNGPALKIKAFQVNLQCPLASTRNWIHTYVHTRVMPVHTRFCTVCLNLFELKHLQLLQLRRFERIYSIEVCTHD